MPQLTLDELTELKTRALRYIGEMYPVAMYITKNGRREMGEVPCEFVGFSKQRLATSERDVGNKPKPIAFHMPTAKFGGRGKSIKNVQLIFVVEYLEARANQV